MKLLEDEELMKGNVSNGMNIHSLILSGLNYLDTRTDFWQQHKPIYARKRDRLLMQQKWNQAKNAKGGMTDKTSDVLSVLEKAEELIEKSEPVEALALLEGMSKKYPIDDQNPSDACHFGVGTKFLKSFIIRISYQNIRPSCVSQLFPLNARFVRPGPSGHRQLHRGAQKP